MARARALRQLIALEPTQEQRSAVEAPFEACFAILGGPATGKSTALAERIARAKSLFPEAEFLVIDDAHPPSHYAAALLADFGREVRIVDDAEAELRFERCCVSLFELDWPEFAHDQIDPEVPGLRSPDRFAQSAFRLIRRLIDAGIAPPAFLSLALRGATEFYAAPPNFADPSLLIATKNAFHDSLDVDAKELTRQHRREVDLAKILTKLYEAYVALAESSGCMTGRDVVAAATRRLREETAAAAGLRARHRLAFVDDAQELTEVEIGLLRAIFGERLDGVTLCGDPASAISLGQRTQPEATFALAAKRLKLREPLRRPHIDTERPKTVHEEAAAIAGRVAEWIESGVRPEAIAVLSRSVRNVEPYEAALLDRNVPVIVSGDVNVFADRRALDALALLWNVHDPFRHDWLLRTLAGAALALSDATLAVLCGEPPDPQRPLFTLDDEPAPTTRASRWNPKRDLRLGWNVIRGERDEALSPEAKSRLLRFRALREGWLERAETDPFVTFARGVWDDALARDGAPGSARAAAQQEVLERLLARIERYLADNADATLGDVLAWAEERIGLSLHEPAGARRAGFVQLMSVEEARGAEFECVAIANLRPGAFPLWYVPEAFMFSPKLGMVPKENSGGGKASRTAKFSYYMFRSKAAQRYNERERRALQYALRRARSRVFATAWGAPTRGITAPELLEELRAK